MVMEGVPVMEPSQSPIMLTISPGRRVYGRRKAELWVFVPFSSNVSPHVSRRTTSLRSFVSTTSTITFWRPVSETTASEEKSGVEIVFEITSSEMRSGADHSLSPDDPSLVYS